MNPAKLNPPPMDAEHSKKAPGRWGVWRGPYDLVPTPLPVVHGESLDVGIQAFGPTFWRLLSADNLEVAPNGTPDSPPDAPVPQEQPDRYERYRKHPVWPTLEPLPIIREPESVEKSNPPPNFYGSHAELQAKLKQLAEDREDLARLEKHAEERKRENPSDGPAFDALIAEKRAKLKSDQWRLSFFEKGA